MKVRTTNYTWLMLAILLVAVFLRAYQLDFGKPQLYHPDEIKLVAQAGRLLDAKFMNKDAFFGIDVYPPLYTYLLAGAMAAYIIFGLLTGHFHSLADVSAAYSADPFQFFLVSRVLVLLLGVATVWLIYLIGKRLYSKNVGLLAALLLAVNFLHVRNSHFGTVDVPAAFFGVLTIYFCVRIYQQGRLWDYMLGAAAMAMAVAVKFSMPMLVLSLIFAHFARYKSSQWLREIFSKKIWLAAFTGLLVFLITCPLIWLDFHETYGGIVGTKKFEQVGKIGSGGGFLSYWTGDQAPGFGVFYPNSIPDTFGWAFAAFILAGFALLLYKHGKKEFLLLAFILPTYWLFEDMSIKAMRHLVPLAPFFALLAALAMDWLLRHSRHKAIQISLGILFLGWIIGWNVFHSLDYFSQLAQTDPRTVAINWIAANIPADSKIIVEDFPPVLINNAEKDDASIPGYEIVHANLAKKTLNSTEEIKKIFTSGESCYYISDSFSRELFNWKFTLQHYAEIANDRRDFFDWLQQNGKTLQVFKSANQTIQPTIVIYQLNNQ